MKKTLFTTAIASIVFLAGCHQAEEKKTTEEKSTSNDSSMVEDVEVTTVEVEENPSDIHFMEAINSFVEKNNNASAMHIMQGIQAYKKETANAKGKVKTMAEANVAALEMLAEKVKKAEVKETSELETEFEKAERIVAHTIIYTVEDVELVPDSISQSESYFSKALAYFKAVVSKDKSKAKKEGEEVASQGDKIEAKLKHKETVSSKDIKDFYHKSKMWLEERISM